MRSVPMYYIADKTCKHVIVVYTLLLFSDYYFIIHRVSKKPGLLRLIIRNFSNSQHLLIIFGRERPCSIWYDKKVCKLALTSCMVSITKVATWHTQTANFWADVKQPVIDRTINESQNDHVLVSRPKDCTSTLVTFDTAQLKKHCLKM